MKKQHYFCILILLTALALAACGHEHSFGDWAVEKKPSCTENGMEVRFCQCGEKQTRILAPAEHTGGPWVIDAEPTCTASGTKHQACLQCGTTVQTQSIPVVQHTQGEWDIVTEATCTEDGLMRQTCSYCGLSLQTADIPAVGHTEGEWIVDTKPTATQEGSKRQICAQCGVTLVTETIPVQVSGLVILDAGHGGTDPGEVVGGIQEKHINLQITYKLKAFLEARGITVILTREEDIFLELMERVDLANGYDAQLFVSVHCNSYDESTSVSGFEIYYHQDTQAKALADAILSDLAATGQLKIRSVKVGNFAVIKYTNMPAILLEMGFLTNEQERKKLCTEEYQQMLADTIASSIVRMLAQTE